MSVQTTDLSLCEPFVLNLELRAGVRGQAYAALVALGDDILDMLPPVYQDEPDTLQRRLVAWGFCIARVIGNTRRVGIYGDFTAHEHDSIVLPALAPFMEAESRYVYRERGTDTFRGWLFQNGQVTLREVERVTEYEFGRAL